MKYKKAVWLALIGIALAAFVHLYNGYLSGLPCGMHTTADDASYLAPAENFWHSGTWKDNSVGISSYIQRPPLQGTIHLVEYLFFGKYAAIVHFFFCLLLHGWSLYRLPALLGRFLPEKKALSVAWIYALLPCFWGFLSFQITESVSPALLLLFCSFLLQKDNTNRGLIPIVLLATAIWLLRPVLLLLIIIPLLIYVWKKRSALKGVGQVIVTVCCLLTVFAWEYRKAGYSGKWGDLHPIYHAQNASLYRPPHAAMSELFRIWETRPEVFHAIVHSAWGEDSTRRSLEFLTNYVSERHVPLSPRKLYQLLQTYAAVNRPVTAQIPTGKPIPQTVAERQFIREVNQTTEQLYQDNKLQYHVLTPMRSAREMLTKSQLNLELFQTHYRGNFIVELLRYVCLTIILLIFIGTLLTLIRRTTALRWFALGVLLYCLYLFYVQRMNEDRYLIPALPVMLIIGSVYWFQLSEFFRRKRSN